MPEQIDSRGTHMTVRPLTPHEMERWPDAEIAFTIHYAQGGVSAHALTLVEHAEEFADTVKQACRDVRKEKAIKETLRGRMVFVRCKCGKLYWLKPFFVLSDEFNHVCPNCGLDVEQGDEVEFDDGWGTQSEKLLPEGVIRHGRGIGTYYTGLNGHRIDMTGGEDDAREESDEGQAEEAEARPRG